MKAIFGIKGKNWIIIGVVAAILLFYFLFDPMKAGWMPQCVFNKLTGLQCMGCGVQRMAHSLLHGDFAGAWQSNAFLLLSLPALIFLTVVELGRSKMPRLYQTVHKLWVIIAIAVGLVVWMVARNVLGL